MSYFITAIRRENGKISEVKCFIGEEKENILTPTKFYTQRVEVVIEFINFDDNPTDFFTSLNKNDIWIKGDKVIAYQANGDWYIKTDGDSSSVNNLENLPLF